MQLLVKNLLITLLLLFVCKSASVEGNNVVPEDQVADEARPAVAKQPLHGPKYVAPAKPQDQPKPITGKVQPKFQPFSPYPQKHHPGYPRPINNNYQMYKQPQFVPPKYNIPPPRNVQINSHQRPFGSVPAHNIKTQQQLAYSASTSRPLALSTIQSPKFSLPLNSINSIQIVKSKPIIKFISSTSTTTSTTTTTPRPLRTKRIWPKHMANRLSQYNITADPKYIDNSTSDREAAASFSHSVRYTHNNNTTTTSTSSTTAGPRVYRKVTRKIKAKSSTQSPFNTTALPTRDNGWVPIMPSHFGKSVSPIVSQRRSSYGPIIYVRDRPLSRRPRYIPTYGFLPRKQVGRFPRSTSARYNSARYKSARQNSAKFARRPRRRPPLNPHVYSGYRGRIIRRPSDPTMAELFLDDLEAAHAKRHVVKIKHHHHHHHHKYVKTVEKPVKVPYKVEVPKPYPVEKKVPVPYPVEKVVHKIVEKKVPVPYPVEKRVHVPVEVKVPAPYPVKVVEKEYVNRPIPVLHHIPVLKQVEVRVPHPVPVPVEKQVPYPVRVNVPVDRPVPYPVPVEKRVPVPVPVKVLVPHPYPVEKRVPYPVEVKVKEPVVQQVPVKVYVPKPYPVSVPRPYPVHVEKRVPYPVEVERKVPVPVKVFVPHPVPVASPVPVFVNRGLDQNYYESKYDSKYESKVTPTQSPPTAVTLDTSLGENEALVGAGLTVEDDYVTPSSAGSSSAEHHQVTIHGNGAFTGFGSRLDSGSHSESTDKPDTK